MRSVVIKKSILIITGIISSIISVAQHPYRDASLSSEERAKDLISRLTLEEKAALMCDVSDAIPRFEIKKIQLVE